MSSACSVEARALRSDARENRDRLLDAAMAAVHREGTAVPMATVAADAGVGVGTLYRHFPTRDDLLDALTHRSFERILENVRGAAAAPGTALERIDRFIDNAIGHRNLLLVPLGGGPPVRTASTKALRSSVHRALQRLLDEGRADGTVRDGVNAADIVLVGGVLAQPGRPTPGWDAAARRLKDIFVQGLRP